MKKITIEQGDITQISVDAIVNAANTSLLGGGGVDGAIHRKGGAGILAECQKIRAKQGGCSVGEAVITTAGNLPAQYVIHTVGPTWVDGQNNETILLESAYRNSFKLAESLQLKTLAFPNISTGIYRFPKQLAAQIALETISDELNKAHFVQEVIFVCFDEENFSIYNLYISEF
ncbi:O-acetyl-ADP-ribose deacetylase [Acinetobacter sp. NIPH 2699]|uniref:O-acetyl-ADP-ribose deacetylase n=1 Tax=Acinetobacter sp. NIPH 2699 TaxID=2923433 RepID=UPI001F4A7E86|nr:O-acetyl-ADP-ribose deacetylase [Acinetobacter sp. NIPH 2699]MCH7335550.1 O-acetyl-ADP-ribose deacetylase [Acinetobacter sp. NIPH 2699]